MGGGGGIKDTFLEEELETQYKEQAGLVGIGVKADSSEQRSRTIPVTTPHPPPCLHPVLPLPQVTDILDEIMAYKGVATLYDLDPEKRFLSFFRSVEPLDEQQR